MSIRSIFVLRSFNFRWGERMNAPQNHEPNVEYTILSPSHSYSCFRLVILNVRMAEGKLISINLCTVSIGEWLYWRPSFWNYSGEEKISVAFVTQWRLTWCHNWDCQRRLIFRESNNSCNNSATWSLDSCSNPRIRPAKQIFVRE